MVASIKSWGPTGTFVSRRTNRLVGMPIELETICVEALLCLPLPFVVRSSGSNQLDAIVELARDELLGLGVVRIAQMLFGQQLLA